MTRLYHFTSEAHLPTILGAGFLRTVESNISFKREHAGPDVVWLTTRDTAEDGLGLNLGIQRLVNDKTAVRFTVEVDKRSVYKWREWARAQGSSAPTIETLARTGGGSSSWRVTTRPIPASQWLEVRNMNTGNVIDLGDVERVHG